MKKPRGISVTIKFGAINVCVEEPEYDVNADNIRNHAKLIKSLADSAARAVIAVQKSL